MRALAEKNQSSRKKRETRKHYAYFFLFAWAIAVLGTCLFFADSN